MFETRTTFFSGVELDDPWDEASEIDINEFLDGSPDFDPNAITQPRKKMNRRYSSLWDEPKCECGSWKTYGEKCSATMHSEWCPMKRKV